MLQKVSSPKKSIGKRK